MNYIEIEKAWRMARKDWLDYLNYSESDVYVDNWRMQYVLIDGFKCFVPTELTNITNYKKSLVKLETI